MAIFGRMLVEPFEGSRAEFSVPIQMQKQKEHVYLLEYTAPVTQGAGGLHHVPFGGRLGPLRLAAAPEGNLFVIDEGSGESLHEYSPDGWMIQDIPYDVSPSPQSVSSVAVTARYVYVADVVGGLVFVFDRKEKAWSSIRTEVDPYRVVASTNDELFVATISESHLVHQVSSTGAVIHSFGSLLNEQAYHSLVLDGYLGMAGEELIFAGRYSSFLTSFSPDGNVRYLRSFVAPVKPPVIIEDGDRRWLRHGTLPASHSLAIVDNTVFVLSRRFRAGRRHAFIAAYELDSGDYLHTLQLPGEWSWTSITVGARRLFAARGPVVESWPLVEAMNPESKQARMVAGSEIEILAKSQGKES
jgi:hypothetical protein